ncbi:threonine ammonia-lyase [Olsenella sp. YH-ols2217]|uniref:L-threonine dehydratase catabolic TdcB n=1 Tax=Kribbibacterium absianum TaxID=3044210 RepID=A0ABT6ZI81_9ACTN|nr:threonine ammonia-lyase [Olsenella sp. YH-ols2217]MDJ1128762.1 threonine ammonia-lyase [Olsenella sp. YH-ols2217]
MLTLDKVYHAAFVLKDIARKTDLIPAPTLSATNEVFLKTENLQNTGSFKLRGASYKMSQLTDEERARGVVACSAGNHAQGVALAASRNGIDAVICLPDGAPISKVEATKGYGATVELVPGVYDDAYARACQIVEEEGRTFIHPFNDEQVIAGQGTIGLEVLDQLPDVDAVVVPIGGGGLASGVAFALKSLNPDVKVYGVQAEGAPSMARSLAAEGPVCLDEAKTIADGIQVKEPGDLTYQLVRDYVDDVVTVSDDEVATAILTLIERHKLIAEGAGAVPVAAVLFDKIPVRGKKVVCLVSGGNIDVTILSKVIERGLLKSGRLDTLAIQLTDKPGQLRDVSGLIARLGANVTGVRYEKASEGSSITDCVLRIDLETRDADHIAQIHDALAAAGYQLL